MPLTRAAAHSRRRRRAWPGAPLDPAAVEGRRRATALRAALPELRRQLGGLLQTRPYRFDPGVTVTVVPG